MDKLGPAQKIIAQQDDDCKDWNVDKLLANMKRYIEKNPLQNEIVIDNEIVIIEMNSTPSDIKTKEWKNVWCNNADLFAFIVKVETIQLTSALRC